MKKQFKPFNNLGIGTFICDEELFVKTGGSLAGLACSAAIDLDNLSLGRETDKYCLQKLVELFEKNKVDESEIESIIPDVSFPLLRAMEKYYNKKFKHIREYTSAMNLLYHEMSSFDWLPKERIAKLRDFSVDLSRQFSAYQK